MRKPLLFNKMLALVACMMCSLGAAAAEAYAVFTDWNETLTFYYDNQRPYRSGETYDAVYSHEWLDEYSDAPDITHVVFTPSFANARPTDTSYWFFGLNLEDITGMEYLNTSEVTDMFRMFQFCTVSEIDLSHFNTAKVTNMTDMFQGCLYLESLDLSSFNTANVQYMAYMFASCDNLKTLDLSSFNTYRVNYMYGMFQGCGNITTIYVGRGWTTEAVLASDDMFDGCTKLVGFRGTTYDANHVDKAYARVDRGPSNPGYMSGKTEAYACFTSSNNTMTFYYDDNSCTREGDVVFECGDTGHDHPWFPSQDDSFSPTHVVFDPSFAGARPKSTAYWFNYLSLESITGLKYLNTSEVTDMSNMFNFLSYHGDLDLSGFNTSNVTDMSGMFMLYSTESLDLSSFNTSNVTNMEDMFNGSRSLTTIHVGSGWTTAAVTSSDDMFDECYNLVGGKGTTYNSNHTDKAYARIDRGTDGPGYLTAATEAYACYTPSNTTLTFYYDNQRFYRSGRIYDLNTGAYDTSWDKDGTNASVSNVVFDPSFANARPTTTFDWFYGMRNLTSIIGLEYLNTSEVTNMAYMFMNCSNLKSLDLSHFNTSKVINMYFMFAYCKGLESLDLSSFNTSRVANMKDMFYDSNNLQTIFVGNGWSTAAVTSSVDMFRYCNQLVGGQGTTYDDNHVDKAYAHIDGGPSNPGYFTKASEAYACYTPSNTTLTFYYDKLRSSRSGTTYDLNEGANEPGWFYDATYAYATRVVFDPSFADARPTTTYGWFYSMENLQSITGMNYLNTSEVTNMGWMFGRCFSLGRIDLSGFNTAKVSNMRGMFALCSSLTSLDVSSFKTTNVTDMMSMFSNCSNLKTIYVGNGWSTAAVTTSTYMFGGSTSLVGGKGTTYDANHVDKAYAHIDGGPNYPGYLSSNSYVVFLPSDESLTFYCDDQRNNREGTIFDLNNGRMQPDWSDNSIRPNVSKVIFDPSFANARPTTTFGWFFGFQRVTSITGLHYLNTSQVTDMYAMFLYCDALKSLDLSNFNTANVTDMAYMFAYCSDLTTIYVGSGWNTDAVTSSSYMFYNCPSLVGCKGTTYDSGHVDKAYAHIDGGLSYPGYLSRLTLGDINGDGLVDVADVTLLIRVVLNSNPVNPMVADLNADGVVDVADVSVLIRGVLNSSLDPDNPQNSGKWLVLIDRDGCAIWYPLYSNPDGEYSTTVSLSTGMFGSGLAKFYFVDEGFAYGAQQPDEAITYGNSSANPLVRGQNYYTAATGYNYVFGLRYDSAGNRFAIAQQGSPIN